VSTDTVITSVHLVVAAGGVMDHLDRRQAEKFRWKSEFIALQFGRGRGAGERAGDGGDVPEQSERIAKSGRAADRPARDIDPVGLNARDRQEIDVAPADVQFSDGADAAVADFVEADHENMEIRGMAGQDQPHMRLDAADLVAARVHRMHEADAIARAHFAGLGAGLAANRSKASDVRWL
jgi:hypothetical protein